MFPPENDYEMFYGSEELDGIGDAGMMSDEEKIDVAVDKQLGPNEQVIEKAETVYGPKPVSYGPKDTPGIIARWRDKLETAVFSLYSPAYKNEYLKASINGEDAEQAKTSALSAMVDEAVKKGGVDTMIAEDAIRGMKYYGASKSGFDAICNNSILKFLFAPVCIIISLVKTVIYIIIAIIGIIAFISILRLVLKWRKESKKEETDAKDKAEKTALLKAAIAAKTAAKS